MLISSFQPSPTFGCIKIKEGGLKFLEQEGIKNPEDRINLINSTYKNSKWELGIDENGYTLTSPTTKKTHRSPFSIRKHYPKDPNKELPCIIVRMGEKNRNRYKINFSLKEEVKKICSRYRKSSSLDKAIIILEILEKNLLQKLNK